MDCTFLVPRDLPGASGGTHYNDAVISGLVDAGHRVEVCRVPGLWPQAGREDRLALGDALTATRLAIVDGIIALAAPDEIEAAAAMGVSLHILVHSLLSADPGLGDIERAKFVASECRALRASTSSSVASHWSLRDVLNRCPGTRPHVVVPGTDRARQSRGSEPPHLLVLAALTPVKNQIHVLRALKNITDLKWTLRLVGSELVDPCYAQTLHRIAAKEFEPGRIILPGVLTGDALDAVWDATDLLLLTSTTETFGMVVTEALARGIPAIVTGGTGAAEALLGQDADSSDVVGPVAGAIVDPRDLASLTDTVRQWLGDPVQRTAWRSAALARRSRLTPWTKAAAELARILQA